MFNRRDFLKTTGLGLVSTAVSNPFLSYAQESGTGRPNILLLLVDDMGWSDIGCYGGEVHTPNIDFLAHRGLRFTQFHNTAKCFPSRACLLTGLYAQQCGMDKSARSRLSNCVTLGEVMRSAGYRTLMTGKYHGLDNPYERGFDRYYGLRDGACNHFNPGEQRAGEGVPAHKTDPQLYPRTWCIDEKVLRPFTPEERDFYTTDYFTRYALGYLDEYAEEDKPFFLYLSYTAPHDPLMAWPEDIDRYRGKFRAGYSAFRKARYERQRDMGLIDDSFPLSDPTHEAWESLTQEQKDEEDLKMAVYCAMIDRVDQNIGMILKKLRAQGELDNTLILFASDNGCSSEAVPEETLNPEAGSGEIGSMTRWSSISRSWANVSNTPFRFYKNYTHKGGSCTPLIAFWPDGIHGENRISHDVGHFIDFMPTFAEIAGAEYPSQFIGERIHPMAGQSLLPILQGKSYERRDPIYWQWRDGKAVRQGNHRLVADKGGPWELYDMRVDKTETTNLADTHPSIVRELDASYRGWESSWSGGLPVRR